MPSEKFIHTRPKLLNFTGVEPAFSLSWIAQAFSNFHVTAPTGALIEWARRALVVRMKTASVQQLPEQWPQISR